MPEHSQIPHHILEIIIMFATEESNPPVTCGCPRISIPLVISELL